MMHIKTDGKIVLDASKQTAQRTHICISDNRNGLPSGSNDRIERNDLTALEISKKDDSYRKNVRKKPAEIINRTDSSGVEVRFEFRF
jgi:hypothetical protein